MNNKIFLQGMIIFIVAFFVYLNSLKNGFIYDDELLILYNPSVKSYSNIPEIFTHHFFNKSITESNIKYYRPITTITYLLNYKLFGINGFYYHLTNVLLHCINSLLLFWLGLFLFNKIENGNSVSLISAVLFAAHPIHTEAVTFISGRTDLLAALFMLISLIGYLKWRQTSKSLFFIISCVSFVFGIFSKEVSLVLPALIVLIEYWQSNKSLREFIKTDLKNILAYLMGFIIIGISYFLMRVFVLKLAAPPYPTYNFYTTQFLMQKVFLFYIKLLIFPINLSVSYINYFTVPKTMFDLWFLSALIINIIIFVGAIWALLKRNILGFCFFWFFITLLPVLNIFPLGMVCAERYLYIPSFGFCFILGYLLSRVKSRHLSIFLAMAVVIVYSGLAYQRNTVWSNSITLWKDVLAKSQNDYLAQTNLAKALLQKGEYKDSQKYITQVFNDKNSPYRHLQIEIYARCLIGEGKYNEAIRELMEIPKIELTYFGYLNYIGEAYNKNGENKKAEEYFLEAIRKDASLIPPRLNLINLYIKQEQFEKALKLCVEVEKLNPDISSIYGYKGFVYQKMGNFGKSITQYKKSISLDTNNAELHFNLAFVYDTLSETKQEYIQSAIKEYKVTLNYKKDYIDALINLGILYARMGQKEQARELWEKVLLIDKNNKTAKENLKILETK